MSEIVANGGTMAYAVLGIGGVGALAALAFAGLSFTKRRVPIAAWLFFPILALLVGAIGAYLGAGTVAGGFAGADPETINASALTGLHSALSVDYLSRWVAAGLLVLSAWCAGVGSFLGAGPDTKWTFVAAAGSGIVALAGAGVVAGISANNGLGTEAFLLAAVIAVGGFGVAFSSLKRAIYEDAFRVAGMRFASAVSYVFAVSYAGKAVQMGSEMNFFGPGGMGNTAELAEAVATWDSLAAPVFNISWFAFGLAFLVAFIAVFNELGEVVARYTLIDTWGAMALLVALGLVRVIEVSATNELNEVGTHGPATMVFAEFGADLPPAIIVMEKEGTPVIPSNGGYNDVFVYQNEEWRRKWAWNGVGFDDDDTPLEEVTGTQGLPLVAIPKGEDASAVTDLVSKLGVSEFLLLSRAVEARDDLQVPAQLAHKQVTFIKFQVDTERDFTTQAWVDAGKSDWMWGSTMWFGEGDDLESAAYADAVFTDTESAGVHILVNDRSRVEGLSISCLAAQFAVAEGGGFEKTDKWCSVFAADFEETRALAKEGREMPEPENMQLTGWKAEWKAGEPQNMGPIEERFQRELGALAWCGEKAKEADPEGAVGPLKLMVRVNKKGKVPNVWVDEKSKNQNREISGCAYERFKVFQFEELPELPEPEEEGERAEDPVVDIEFALVYK